MRQHPAAPGLALCRGEAAAARARGRLATRLLPGARRQCVGCRKGALEGARTAACTLLVLTRAYGCCPALPACRPSSWWAPATTAAPRPASCARCSCRSGPGRMAPPLPRARATAPTAAARRKTSQALWTRRPLFTLWTGWPGRAAPLLASAPACTWSGCSGRRRARGWRRSPSRCCGAGWRRWRRQSPWR